MRQLTLTEHQTSRPVTLSTDEVAALLPIRSLRIEPAGPDSVFTLTPGSEVGAIELNTLSIVIEPKISIERVLFLTSYAIDPRAWRDDEAPLLTKPLLVEAMIPVFIAQARRAFARGLLQGYRTEEEASLVIRGRLLFDELIRRRFGETPPADVRFDDFNDDIDANRLIKAAVRRLARMRIRSAAARRSLNLLESALERVRHVEFAPNALPTVTYTRLNRHYRPVIELSKLILRSTSFELGHGTVRGSAFLLDMNTVFENFVVVALREALALSEREFPQGHRCPGLYLAEGPKVRLKPDFSWWELGRCTFVGGVKYKRLRVAGYENPDLYQLLAYATAAGLPGGLLVYAKGERHESRYAVHRSGVELEVRTLSLDGTPDSVISQVHDLAGRVRYWRTRAFPNEARVAAPAL